MRVRQFESDLWLPQSREKVFQFFSDVANLDRITPPWLHFRTVEPGQMEMRKGIVIEHALRIHGLPLRWCSVIKEWDPPSRFVDEQIRGPYRLWVHEHKFEERDGGTLVHDHVHYAVLMDFLLHRFFIRPDIERIFAYRQEQLRALFDGR
jgi:hypothetical protein